MQPRKVPVTCSACGKQYLKDRFSLPAWQGQCQECARPAKVPWTVVTCRTCGKEWRKWTDSLGVWKGECRSCAYKARFSDPDYLQRHSARAQQQVLAQGGVPNARKLTKENTGAAHYQWKGGVTPAHRLERTSVKALAWSRAVKERDNYTCQGCGRRGGDLHSHHIQPFATHPELRHEIENGRTLCVPCHRKQHSRS